ncbi:hypothetical protein CSW64_12250 [Caulobacter mirabilis]|uniref:Uncharacterized protein n=2 Tax=Caulobacter mirabilis TaxID=69666 RepID=A0A2D2AYR0_9CAUL|nr:hypothetical protein CSW64_12250 [Caulobacter mirabilis]
MPLPVWAKFTICIVFDLIDMTFGRAMLGVGILTDVGNALIMFWLWGPTGLLAAWEAADVTEQFDGFVPTNTILAWAAHKKSVST